MDNIRRRHIISISVLFAIGSSVITISSNGYHCIQSLIMAFVLSLLVYFLYHRLLEKYPGMNLFEIIKYKYNNIFGKTIIIIYIIFLVLKAARIVYMFTDFISTINQLDFLSKNLIMILNMILLGYFLKSSLISLCRFSQTGFILTLLMIAILFILGIKDINYTNLLPIIPIHKNDFFYNTLVFLVQPFLEMSVLYNVICKMKFEKEKKNIFYLIAFISLIVLLFLSIETIGILGDNYAVIINYPYYSAIASINVSKIVIRIESMSLIIFYYCEIIKIIFLIYSIILGINTLANSKKKIYYPLLLLIHVLSLIVYDNISELKEMTKYYCIFALIFLFIIPLLLLIKKDKKIINHNT